MRLRRTKRAPGRRHALCSTRAKPDQLTTVFAGQDAEATERARSYFTGYPPSSPQIALLKDGKIVFMLERWQIEGRSADAIADDLIGAFDEHCRDRDARAARRSRVIANLAASPFLRARQQRRTSARGLHPPRV